MDSQGYRESCIIHSISDGSRALFQRLEGAGIAACGHFQQVAVTAPDPARRDWRPAHRFSRHQRIALGQTRDFGAGLNLEYGVRGQAGEGAGGHAVLDGNRPAFQDFSTVCPLYVSPTGIST